MKFSKNRNISTSLIGILSLCSVVACNTPHVKQKTLTPITEAMIQGVQDLGDCQYIVDILQALRSGQQVNVNVLDPNHPGYNLTALHRVLLSIAIDYPEVAEVLVERGADINAREDQYGCTPLHYVILGNHSGLLKFWLEQPNVHINAKDNKGNTPLHYLTCQPRLTYQPYSAIVQILLSHLKHEVNAQNDKGQTPLHIAIRHSSPNDLSVPAIIQALLNHPYINVNVEDNKGRTFLHIAIRHGSPGVILALLNHPDIDVSAKDKNGETPLALMVARLRTMSNSM